MSNPGQPGQGDPSPSFLELDIDLHSLDFTAEERDRMLAWYRENHEVGDSDLSKFAAFVIAHDPGGFKRYRRHIATIDRPVNGIALPQAAHLLGFLYAYMVIGYEKGIIYVAVNARQLGASRDEILDVVRLAVPAAGPVGLNASAERLDSYLRDWPAHSGEPGLIWPEGWAPNPDAFRSGIDPSTDELSSGEVALIESWYQKVYGEIPSHVRRMAKYHPVAYKTQRLRFEGALGPALPAQMAPLCMLFLAAMRGWRKPTLRAAQLAHHLGVRRSHLLAALTWAGVYGDEMILESAFDVLGPLIDSWE
jgi:hypothetical protein